MKIKGTSNYIRIEDFEGKNMTIVGEMMVHGFIAYKESMTHWDEPNGHLPVSDEEKERLIEAVNEETKNKDFKIEFE